MSLRPCVMGQGGPPGFGGPPGYGGGGPPGYGRGAPPQGGGGGGGYAPGGNSFGALNNLPRRDPRGGRDPRQQ